MNLIEAKEQRLILETSKNPNVEPRRWKLVTKIMPGVTVLTTEGYSAGETQNLIDLLERVRAESIVPPENTQEV